MHMIINEHISSDPNIRFGKPVIQNTRIAVQDILEMLAGGMSADEIIADYPQLDKDKIIACLAYASNREKFYTYVK